MDINQKTQHINSFTGGMNTDTADSMLSNNQYRHALNLRYITSTKNNSGELHPIEELIEQAEFGDKILATVNIRDTIVVLFSKKYHENQQDVYVKNSQHEFGKPLPNVDVKAGRTYFYIARIEFDRNGDILYRLVLGPCEGYVPNHKLSIETRYEDENVQKLYIADGENPIMSINVMQYNGTNINSLFTIPSVTFNKIIFDKFIPGSLRASTVQYSYQLYKKYGRESLISPPTKKLDIVNLQTTTEINDYNKHPLNNQYTIYEGIGENKNTNCGIQMLLNVDNTDYFDSIKIYRISYFTNTEYPYVELIIDSRLNGSTFTIIDDGLNALEKLNIGLYNNISGVHIIPKSIKSKNNMLFAANLKEKQFSIDSFENYDARAYQFNSKGLCRMYDNNGDVHVIHENTLQDDAKNLPYKYCINKGNNINSIYQIYGGNIGEQQDEDSGNFDRYTKTEGEKKYRFYGGSGINISWKFVTVPLDGDSLPTTLDDKYKFYGSEHNINRNSRKPLINQRLKFYYITNKETYIPINYSYELSTIKQTDWTDYKDGEHANYVFDYSNPKIAMSFKSLRRDELYRYGIVLYDKNGNRSSVRWIADIRVPSIYVGGFQHFDCKSILPMIGVKPNGSAIQDSWVYNQMSVNSLGIEFTIHNLPDECVSYEIVRADRTINDIATLSQGVISRPVQYVSHRYDKRIHETENMLTPTGLLTTGRVWHGDRYHAHSTTNNGQNVDTDEASNYRNGTVYQFISPEISYQKQSTFDLLKQYKLNINPQLYVFGACGWNGYKHGEDTAGDFSREEFDKAHYAIHPAVTNCNLPLQIKRIGIWDTDKKEESTNYNVPNLDKPVNDRLSISLNHANYLLSFHSIRMNKQWNDQGWHPSNVPPQHINVRYEVGQAQDRAVNFNANNLQDALRRSYAYIKLYNKSSAVLLRGHNGNEFDCDAYWNDNKFNGYPAIIQFSYNKCDIDEIKLSHDFMWNDFADENDNVKFKTKYFNIGNYNYCNWACGGHYSQGAGGYRVPNDYNPATLDYRTNLYGPAGSCLLFSINNKWVINNTPDYANVGNRKSYLFSDTIGTNRIDYPAISDSEYTPQNPEYVLKYVSQQIGLSKDSAKPYYDQNPRRDFRYNEVLMKADPETAFTEKPYYSGFIPESIAGTYISNIRKQVTPYGGYSWEAIENTKYYSSGDVAVVTRTTDGKVINQGLYVFNGDCYIVPFEYTSLYKYYSPRDTALTTNITYCIPVESNINIARDYGTRLSYDYNKYDKFAITNIQREASNVNNILQQSKPQYLYNTAYSSPNRTMLHLAIGDLSKSTTVNNLDTRVRYSNQKSNKEAVDSWLTFKAANYIDIDARYGEVTHLDIFSDNLIFFQTDAVGRLAVNDRVALQDTNNISIALGTGGVLERYDYITEQNGMYKYQQSSVSTEHGLYWYDAIRNEILRYSLQGGVTSISKEKTVQNLLNKYWWSYLSTIDGTVHYDKKYNEIYFNIYPKESKVLIFNEYTQAFTSEYLMRPTSWFMCYGSQYLVQDNKIYSYMEGIVKNVSLTYVVNSHPELVKVYDTQRIITNAGIVTGVQISQYYSSDTGDVNQDNIKCSAREGDVRLAVPRVNNAKYGDRLRGKTASITLTLKGSLDGVSISNIITKYRISWS